MESKVTRRQLAATLVTGATAFGQTPSAAPPRNSDDELKAAREQFREFGDRLSKFDIPMSTEPAFQFKA